MNALRSPAARHRLSVLIADDEPDTIATLAAVLSDEGYVVHTVSRGDEVLRAVQRHRPDVCILDIEMPGRSGYALAEELSSWSRSDQPVLVAISGVYVRKTDQLLAKVLGFAKFFRKPADPQQVIRFLDELRDGSGTAA